MGDSKRKSVKLTLAANCPVDDETREYVAKLWRLLVALSEAIERHCMTAGGENADDDNVDDQREWKEGHFVLRFSIVFRVLRAQMSTSSYLPSLLSIERPAPVCSTYETNISGCSGNEETLGRNCPPHLSPHSGQACASHDQIPPAIREVLQRGQRPPQEGRV
jgi:hypothetical protein